MARIDEFSKLFNANDYKSCRHAVNAGTRVVVALVENCGNLPVLYSISTSALAVDDETADLQLVSASQDGVTVTTPDSVYLRAGLTLYFETAPDTYVPVTLAEEATVLSASATTVAVDPVTAVVALDTEAQTFAMLEVEETTDVPINQDPTATNTTVLSRGLRGSQIKTKLDMNSALALISSPQDRAQWEILQKAANTTQNAYFVIQKPSGLLAFGSAQVLASNWTGAREDTENSTFNLSFQDNSVNTNSLPTYRTAEEILSLNKLFRHAGLGQN